MTALELLVIATLIFTSAYVAASEVALFSLSRFQLRYFKDRARRGHRKIKRLLADPGGLLVTILVVSEILNIAISMMITRGVANTIPISVSSWETRYFHLPVWCIQTLLGTLITAPVILLLCEITPKAIAARANQLIAPLTVNTMTIIYNLCKPIRIVLMRLLTLVGRPDTQETLKESDFLLMLEEGHKEGVVQASEVELIKNVFEFDDTTVAEVFTPLNQVRSLTKTTTTHEALLAIRSQRFSRIPVTNGTRREVVGILYSKDLLRAKLEGDQLNLPISEIMLDPIFVMPTMKLNALFRMFKRRSTHMAIVQKQTGEAIGVITMSDVMDILFEDIFPPEDLEDDLEDRK
jgi:putative hemolysin